jgi:hypothetical protein
MLSSQYLLKKKKFKNLKIKKKKKKIKEEEEEEGIKKLCIELHLYYLQPKFSITFSLW